MNKSAAEVDKDYWDHLDARRDVNAEQERIEQMAHAEILRCDERFTQKLTSTLPLTKLTTRTDSFPYRSRFDNANTSTLAVTNAIQCFRHGYWVSWDTSADLSYLAVDTVESKNITGLEQKIRTFSSGVA